MQWEGRERRRPDETHDDGHLEAGRGFTVFDTWVEFSDFSLVSILKYASQPGFDVTRKICAVTWLILTESGWMAMDGRGLQPLSHSLPVLLYWNHAMSTYH